MFKAKILLSAIAVIGSLLGAPVAAQEVPFDPQGQPNGAVQRQSENAAEVIRSQRDGGQGARDAADDLWESMITADGAYFGTIIDGLSILTVLGFVGWGFVFFWQWRSGLNPKAKLLAQPLMVVMFFANDGALLAATANGGRYLVELLSNSIFDASINGVTGRAAVQQEQNAQAAREILTELLARCDRYEGDRRERCREEARQEAQEYFEELQGEVGFLESVALDIEGVVVDLGFSPGLYFVSASFFLVLEYLMSIWGLLTPLFVAAHLLPRGRIGLNMMAAGLISVGSATLVYTVLSSASAIFLSTGFAGNPSFYALLIGIVNPAVSLGFGAYGLSAGLSGAAQTVSLFSRLFRRY